MTTTIYLPDEVAEALLASHGWTAEPIGRNAAVAYVRPGGTRRADGGRFGTDWLWGRDEALQQALIAEGGADTRAPLVTAVGIADKIAGSHALNAGDTLDFIAHAYEVLNAAVHSYLEGEPCSA